MFKVLVTDKIDKIACDILAKVAQVDYKDTMPEDELAKIIGEYDALMVRSQTKVTPKIIENAKKMKIMGRAGVGVDNIDLEQATQKGIIVVNSPDGNTTAAAEHTVALMLSMTRHIPDAAISTKNGKWERSKFTGTEVFKKTLGIVGLGKIGSRVAKAAVGLGMNVIVYDPFANKESIESLGASQIASLEDFWPLCDYISVHVPKTKETQNLINTETFTKMKDGVRIINCARGGIINEADLKEALENGKVAQAAIDVFSKEPLEAENPLLACTGDLILTPHLGASTEEAQLNVAIDVAEQIKEVLAGGSAKSAVNLPAMRAEKLEPVKQYMNLAENIGSLVSQLCKSAINEIEIKTIGELANIDTSPLKLAILKGVFSTNLEGVNYVNAPIIAKNRGINVVETKTESTKNYTNAIAVKIKTENAKHSVHGALIADEPRIVKIDDYITSVIPAEHILITPHEDKPSMIAKVATVLGQNDINISMLQVAQKDKTANGESTMIFVMNKTVEAPMLEKLKQIDGVYDAIYVNLKPEQTAKKVNINSTI